MPNLLAVIGGSGLYSLTDGQQIEGIENNDTRYGSASAEIESAHSKGKKFLFMPRHGKSHHIPPHLINYRANIMALSQLGVTHIIAVNAVGGISPAYKPGAIGLPDQIIDYTSGREHSFCDGKTNEVLHVDFTNPYSSKLREVIMNNALDAQIDIVASGTYGCTNGPRFETRAEIHKMKSDGCDIIGMTGMPEAALARELGIEYASIVLVVNWCAGISEEEINMGQIMQGLETGMKPVRRLIFASLKNAL